MRGNLWVKTNNDKESAYQPARDIHQLRVGNVIAALDNQGLDNIPTGKLEARAALSRTLEQLEEELQTSKANRLLVDI